MHKLSHGPAEVRDENQLNTICCLTLIVSCRADLLLVIIRNYNESVATNSSPSLSALRGLGSSQLPDIGGTQAEASPKTIRPKHIIV